MPNSGCRRFYTLRGTGIKVWDALSKDGDIDWKSAGINGGKLALDIVFTFGKSTNPVFLGASVAYGVADYLTNDY
jgi:hypothetical protein